MLFVRTAGRRVRVEPTAVHCVYPGRHAGRRLTGINPGEMTRLIKQIGQNIIGSVVRPHPSRKHYTVRLCTPPHFPSRALDGLNERVRKY